VFGKGNMISRHINIRDLEDRINRGVFSPLFSSLEIRNRKGSQFIDSNGWFCERNSDWYVSAKRHRYFKSLDSFGDFMFRNWRKSDYVSFCPGACFLVEASRLSHVGGSTFKALSEVVSYDFFPTEAYFAERVLGGVLSLNLELREEWRSLEYLRSELSARPDLTNVYVHGAGPFRGLMNTVMNVRKFW
jgi:hypothetical protein